MRKKLLSVLLTLTLLLSTFPAGVLAVEPDGEGESAVFTTEMHSVDPEFLEYSNDDLFYAYLMGMDEVGFFGERGKASLQTDTDKKIYDFLKSEIATVATDGGSTEFTVKLSDYFKNADGSAQKTTWEVTDFNDSSITDLGTESAVSEAAKTKMSEHFAVDFDAIVTALLVDCPYELYWFDKTAGYSTHSAFRYAVQGEEGTDRKVVSLTIIDPTITFLVSEDYQCTDYYVPEDDNDTTPAKIEVTSEVSKLDNVVTNANAIVTKYKDAATDYERLYGYMEEICALVSYDYAAIGKEDDGETDLPTGKKAYGDPWQIIKVFDHASGETGKVVCEGYSKAFQYLCDLTPSWKDQNFACYIVTGDMDGGTGAGGHMWNIVTLGGKNYIVDVTNCDTGSIGAPDKLFLAGATLQSGTGSLENKNATYEVAISGQNPITYHYDNGTPTSEGQNTDDMYELWGTGVLKLSGENCPDPRATAHIQILKDNTAIENDSLYAGQPAVTYTAKVFDKSNQEVTPATIAWTVEPGTGTDADAVSVDTNGTVTVTKAGNVDLVASAEVEGETVTGKLALTVLEPAEFDLSDVPATMTFTYGDAAQAITGIPADLPTGTTVNYTSNTADVVKIENGNVSPLKVGTDTITVTLTPVAGDYAHKTTTATIAVTVNKAQLTLPTLDDITYLANAPENASEAALKTAVTTAANAKLGTGFTALTDGDWTITSTWDAKGGEYTFTATPAVADPTNYEITGTTTTLTQKVTVTPISATLSLTPASKAIKASTVADATDLTVLNLPEVLKVTCDPARATISDITIIGWKNGTADFDVAALKAAAGEVTETADKELTLTPVYTEPTTPAWATWSSTVPTFKLILTNKTPVDVTVTPPADITYGETLTAPSAETNPAVEGAEFTYSYSGTGDTTYGPSETAPTNAGTYQVTATLTAPAEYMGTDTATFTIAKKDLSGATVTLSPEEYTYTGNPCEPTVTVKDGDTTLTKDTDYTVAYSKNTDVSDNDPSVTVTGIGNYTGTKTANFKIKPSETPPVTENPVISSVTIESSATPIVTGTILTANATVNPADTTLSYQWYQIPAGATPSETDKKIETAGQGVTYTVTVEDAGMQLYVKVYVEGTNPEVNRNSDPVTVIEQIIEDTVILQPGTNPEPVVDPAIPEEDRTAVTDTAASTMIPDLFQAAQEALMEIARGHKGADVTEVKVETSIAVSARSYTNTETTKSLRLDLTPQYTITVVKNDSTTEKVVENEPIPALTAAVTVSVDLPVGFPTDNLFVRHFNSNGSVKEVLKVTVEGRRASWKQSSFSEVEIFQSAPVTVTFPNSVGERTYNVDDIGSKLPEISQTGYRFNGWKVNGILFTEVTQAFLDELAKGTPTILADFTEISNPPSDTTPSGGSASSGTSSPALRPLPDRNGSSSQTDPGTTTQPTLFFTDVPATYWNEGRNAILWASENGFMNGTSATTFQPDGRITRQAMWMILARLSGANPANMTEARTWAVNNGISDGTNPNNNMSRQQMVTLLYRYAQFRGIELTGSAELTTFPDNGSVSAYAQAPLAWAVANSIVAGTSQGTLNPTGTATRAQFAVILQRFYNGVVNA